jgi:hypothetical protein
MWSERIEIGGTTNPKQPIRFVDCILDNNLIEHNEVGIHVGADATRVLATGNRFVDVKKPYVINLPGSLKVLDN